MKILNLYSGIGCNRLYWPIEASVTAVDTDPEALDIYRQLFPGDAVLCEDAKAVLRDGYQNYDFIWCSPPCQTHSRYALTRPADFVDMELYELIIFLRFHFKGKWIVENVRPYYPMLIPAIERGRHLLWTNFYVPEFNVPSVDIGQAGIETLRVHHELPPGPFYTRKQLRNGCHPRIGEECVKSAFMPNDHWSFDCMLSAELAL